MLNSNKTGLKIFDNFIIDRGLPKFNKNLIDQNTKFQNVEGGSIPDEDDIDVPISQIMVSNVNDRFGNFVSLEQISQRNNGITIDPSGSINMQQSVNTTIQTTPKRKWYQSKKKNHL